MAKTAFLGLGLMVNPNTGHLAKAGRDVAAYNHTTASADVARARTGFCAQPALVN